MGMQTTTEVQSIAIQLAERFVQYKDHIDSISSQLAQYKRIIDLCPLPTMFHNQAGHCIYVNPIYLKLVDAGLEDVQHDFWVDFIHYEDRIRVINQWHAFVVEADKVMLELECRFIRHDGRIVDVLMKAQEMPSKSIVAFVVPTKFESLAEWLRGADLTNLPDI